MHYQCLLHYQEHPRLRGYNSDTFSLYPAAMGSPPRVRVLHFAKSACKDCDRITPACAGITSNFYTLYSLFQDHPRLRGYYVIAKGKPDTFTGSPPPARVLHSSIVLIAKLHRITPACAGITLVIIVIIKTFQDHPRLRGYDSYASMSLYILPGSPPRVQV